MELTDSKVNGSDKNDGNDKNGAVEQGAEPTSLSTKFKNIINSITVEPYLFLYIFPTVVSALAVQKLNMEKACRADLNYTEFICSDAISGNLDENTTMTALNELQKLVAQMSTWQQPLQSGIPAIIILFVGAWSDQTGNRKFLMFFPMFGEFVSALGLILTTYFFLEWPLWVTALIEALPAALTGGISVALMGSYSFVADVTTPESRTFRMGCVGVIVTFGIPLGSSISGVLTNLIGYYGIFGLNALAYAFGLLYVYFRIHNIRHVKTEGTFTQKIKKFFNPKNAWDTISLLFLTPKKQLIQLWLLIWAHIVILGPVFGEGPVRYLHALKQFSMDVVEFSLYATYSTLVGMAGCGCVIVFMFGYGSGLLVYTPARAVGRAIPFFAILRQAPPATSGATHGIYGQRIRMRKRSRNLTVSVLMAAIAGVFSYYNRTAVAIGLFSKIMKMRDELLGIISATSKTLAHFTYGLAPTKLWFYAGVIVDFFGNCGSTVVRSLSTQVVKPDEVGKACSLIGFVESIIPVVYTPIYSSLYAKTIDVLPGAFYLLGGTMSIPAIFIFVFLYYMYKKRARDVVKDPNSKEMHAHENAVTVL